MKKNLQNFTLLIVFLFAEISFISAQNILSINLSPANPTSNDTLVFLASCEFSSGNCDPVMKNSTMNGNNVMASALHCLGVLSFICHYTDTFIIPPQAAGNYNFIFHLESGHLPNCTPGIVPGPTDTLAFTVSAATGIKDVNLTAPFSIIPNPSNGNFTVSINNLKENEDCRIEILNLSGIVIEQFVINKNKTAINMDLPKGIYMCRLSSNPSVVKKFVIVHTN